MARIKTPEKRSPERNAEEQRVLKQLGNAVASMASKQGISLEKMAYSAGLSKSFIYDLVKGRGNPTVLLLRKLADAGNTSIGQLLKGL